MDMGTLFNKNFKIIFERFHTIRSIMTKKHCAIGIPQEPQNIDEKVHRKKSIFMRFINLTVKAGHERLANKQ